MNYKIDVKRITDGNVYVQGWALPRDPYDEVFIYVYEGNKELNDVKIARTLRKDVAEICLKNYDGDAYFGFSIEFPFDENANKTYEILIKSSKEKAIEKVNRKNVEEFNSFEHKKKELISGYLNNNTFERAFDFLLKEGPIAFIKKAERKLKGLHVDYDYAEWYELTKIKDEELEAQKVDDSFKTKPFYSIVIPVYDTSDAFLKLLFTSIFNQTYQNFEVCVADATDYSCNKNNPKKFFEKYYSDKSNFKVKYLNENKSIADNTNIAIEMASGDYIVLCDHDDELTLDALYEVTKYINEHPDVKLLYSDEDKVDTKSNDFFEPAFKPDFSIDMLLSVNYFCHLTTIKKSLLDEIKNEDGRYERAEYNGAQDYDLFLRLVNKIINNYEVSQIIHIPKVLYHWRCHKGSTSKNVTSKDYAFINGANAVKNFYNITKLNFPKVKDVEKGYDYGLYHTIYEKSNDEPLISIIIPNKDHHPDLDVAINSVANGLYKNIEFIICENNSTESATFEYYKKLEDRKDINVKIVKYADVFNYSKINNYASKYASGEYLLFLNNDVEMINKDSIFEMASYIKRDDVGAVGAKLLYKDKTIQHAGVVLGFGGVAGHTFIGLHDVDHSYMNRAHIVQDYNAVTAACLLTKKTIFEKVGGFDESIAVAFNDIDLCIKIRQLGKLIVYNPYSTFFHYESKSRGYEDTKEKVDRFNRETAYVLKKWSDVLGKIDEYYNPNLTLRKSDFSLRNLKFEKIGEIFPIPKEIQNLINSI